MAMIRASEMTTLGQKTNPSGTFFQLDRKDSLARPQFKMRGGRLIALVYLLVCHVGCVSPIALGTMETAGSNAPVVFNHLRGGQEESFCIAKYDAVIAATLRAGEALSLEVQEKKVEKDQAYFRFCDAKKDKIEVFVERRSDTMTSITFDVGWFGSLAFERLMARQVISELSQSESFLEDWTPKINN
jgi:hypothetical protein